MKKLFLLYLTLVAIHYSWGQTSLKRICRSGNNNDIFFNDSSTCTILTPIKIYARENVSFGFFELGSINSFPTSKYIHNNANVPNNKNWEYFLNYKKVCGTDTLEVFTDTLLVDIKPPTLSLIDSVSVIPCTNQIIIGWKSNKDLDFESYTLYKYNNPDPRLKENFTDTNYLDIEPNQVENTIYTYEITTVDSCGNRTPFGNASHGTVVLSGSIDTCKNTVNLNWNAYKGWNAKNIELYKSINNGVSFIKLTDLSPASLSFSDPDAPPGNIYTYYIRYIKDDSENIGSSSNCVTLKGGVRVEPNKADISYVTVENSLINIGIERDIINNSYAKIELYKVENTGSTLLNTITGLTNKVTTNDNINTINKYYLVSYNTCNETYGISDTSNNIVLGLSENSTIDLTWNNYFTWNNGVEKYTINRASGSSADEAANFMEINAQSNNTFSEIGDVQNTYCYKIIAYESAGSNKSESNTVCNIRTGNLFYPTCIRIGGDGFNFVGIGINYTESKIEIYNRWGNSIYKSDLTKNWQGMNINGEEVDTGVYYFVAEIVQGKETKRKNGTITVIK